MTDDDPLAHIPTDNEPEGPPVFLDPTMTLGRPDRGIDELILYLFKVEGFEIAWKALAGKRTIMDSTFMAGIGRSHRAGATRQDNTNVAGQEAVVNHELEAKEDLRKYLDALGVIITQT